MTQLEKAVKGEATLEIETVATDEGQPTDLVMERVAQGQIVIPANERRRGKIVGIGRGLRTKINASIGSSTAIADIAMEVKRRKIAEKYGADTLMDLSVGGDIPGIRRAVMDAISLPVGTVPLYEAFALAIETIRGCGEHAGGAALRGHGETVSRRRGVHGDPLRHQQEDRGDAQEAALPLWRARVQGRLLYGCLDGA